METSRTIGDLPRPRLTRPVLPHKALTLDEIVRGIPTSVVIVGTLIGSLMGTSLVEYVWRNDDITAQDCEMVVKKIARAVGLVSTPQSQNPAQALPTPIKVSPPCLSDNTR